MKIDCGSDFVQGHGTLYNFRVRNASGHIVWSGHGFLTEASRNEAATIALASLNEKEAALKRKHPAMIV